MTVSKIEDARTERDSAMREALQEATDSAIKDTEGLCSYAIVVVMDNGTVRTRFDEGRDSLRLLGGLDVIGARIIEELHG